MPHASQIHQRPLHLKSLALRVGRAGRPGAGGGREQAGGREGKKGGLGRGRKGAGSRGRVEGEQKKAARRGRLGWRGRGSQKKQLKGRGQGGQGLCIVDIVDIMVRLLRMLCLQVRALSTSGKGHTPSLQPKGNTSPTAPHRVPTQPALLAPGGIHLRTAAMHHT